MRVEDSDVTTNEIPAPLKPQERSRRPVRPTPPARPAPVPRMPAPKRPRWSPTERALLLFSLVSGAITHGYHLFLYPLYVTDEGIYMERAWSVLHEGRLSPYTYNYDHAPAGWLVIAAWAAVLPRQMQAFGSAVNTGRVLMLLVHIGSTFFLFEITRRLSGSALAAVVATFLFNFSPLAIFYQREVVLDNLMVFWVLLSLYLATSNDRRVLTPMYSGLAFGLAVLTKENAIFFVPGLAYLLFGNLRHQFNRRFALGLSAFLTISIISVYFLYAVLKNELVPAPFDFNLNQPPTEHVSLLYTVWWQLHRNQGSLLNRNSPVWQFSLGSWLPKDAFLITAGAASVFLNLYQGFQDRKGHRNQLIVGLLAGGYMFYLARGSIMLEFYVVPLVPFLALSLGIAADRLLPVLARPAVARTAVLAAFGAVLISPIGGYLLVHDTTGKVVPHDLYKLNLTGIQEQQYQYIRLHIPPDARVIMDEEFWVDLHGTPPYYPNAHSHFEATGDPAIRDKVFAQTWQNVDYIVMSNKMRQTMQQDNTSGQYNWIFDALDNHATRIWVVQHGDIELEIWQVQH